MEIQNYNTYIKAIKEQVSENRQVEDRDHMLK